VIGKAETHPLNAPYKLITPNMTKRYPNSLHARLDCGGTGTVARILQDVAHFMIHRYKLVGTCQHMKLNAEGAATNVQRRDGWCVPER
jgi:hypothetical protein